MSTPEIPDKAEKRQKVPRTYDIFQDQADWLANSNANKAKTIRSLLDNHIEEIDETIIDNLREEITTLKNINKLDNDEWVDNIRELEEKHADEVRECMETIESQKAVIVALGGEQ